MAVFAALAVIGIGLLTLGLGIYSKAESADRERDTETERAEGNINAGCAVKLSQFYALASAAGVGDLTKPETWRARTKPFSETPEAKLVEDLTGLLDDSRKIKLARKTALSAQESLGSKVAIFGILLLVGGGALVLPADWWGNQDRILVILLWGVFGYSAVILCVQAFGAFRERSMAVEEFRTAISKHRQTIV